MARRAGAKKKKRPVNRVDQMRALDQYAGSPRAGAGSQAPGFRQRVPRPAGGFFRTPGGGAPPIADGDGAFGPGPGAQQGGGGPFQISHPFIPGAGIHPIVPSSMAEPGSAPGSPNLAAMVMSSFQPSNIESMPSVVNPGYGQPKPNPNPNYNFGGGNQLPQGTMGMQPNAGQQPRQPQRRQGGY